MKNSDLDGMRTAKAATELRPAMNTCHARVTGMGTLLLLFLFLFGFRFLLLVIT
jgi:hypothetical protein